MVNKNSIKAMKIPAEPSSGNDFSKVLTSLLILGIAFTLLKGLTTRRTLNPLSLILNLKKSITLYNTAFNKDSLPRKYNYEIYKVPRVSQIGELMN